MIRLHRDCDRGMAGMCYPDGRAVLDQPLVLLEAFAVIADQKAKLRKENQSG